MTSRLAFPLAALLALAAALPALAQEKGDAPAPPLAGIGAKISGMDVWFGTYWGPLSCAALHVVAADAGEGRVEIKTTLRRFLGGGSDVDSVMVSDSDLCLISLQQKAFGGGNTQNIACTVEGKGKASWEKRTSTPRRDGGPTEEVVEAKSIDLPPGTMHFWALFLVVPALDWADGTRYAFSLLLPAGEIGRCTVSWAGEDTVDLHGNEVAVTNVRVEGPSEESEVVFSLADGRVVQSAGASKNDRTLAWSADEAKAKLRAAGVLEDEPAPEHEFRLSHDEIYHGKERLSFDDFLTRCRRLAENGRIVEITLKRGEFTEGFYSDLKNALDDASIPWKTKAVE